MDNNVKLLRERHAKYFLRCLSVLPSSLDSFDAIRLSIAFFAISGLDILKSLHFIENEASKIIDWIYKFQIIPPPSGDDLERCGFRGSLAATTSLESVGLPASSVKGSVSTHPLDTGHITMTYTALATLLILGDDLKGIHKQGILAGLKALQLENGSFSASLQGSENDVRFIYCAACVCYLMKDWSAINIDSASNFIINSISYEGAIGQDKNQEAHAGLTYCGIAALSLMGTLDTSLSQNQKERLIRWLVLRQQSGFHGRPNKPVDTCYSFWVGATLKLLNANQYINVEKNREFVLSTQCTIVGGFAKWVDFSSDPLHSCLGLSGLSICGDNSLEEIHPALNITMRAYRHWESLEPL